MMVYKIKTAIVLLFLICGCKNKHNYFNHEKWKVHEINDLGYFNGEPREVTTIFYDQLLDTSINSTGHVNTTEAANFDEDGNLVSGFISIDTFTTLKFYNRNSDSGVIYHSFGSTDNNKTFESEHWTENMPLDKYRYLKSHFSKYDNVVKKDYVDTMFSTKDQMIQTRAYSNSFIKEKTWFKENRIIRKEKSSNTNSDTIFYYRNKQNFLDSIVSTDQDKEIFINNEYGHPLFYFKINGNDTTIMERSQYQYDSKGNWIRQFSYRKSQYVEHRPNERFPNYYLTVRKIKY